MLDFVYKNTPGLLAKHRLTLIQFVCGYTVYIIIRDPLFPENGNITKIVMNWVYVFLQLVVKNPREPSHRFEWGSLYMLTGDYMKAKECFHDAVSLQQTHQPRLETVHTLSMKYSNNIQLLIYMWKETNRK